jgi:hypothetical protein
MKTRKVMIPLSGIMKKPRKCEMIFPKL